MQNQALYTLIAARPEGFPASFHTGKVHAGTLASGSRHNPKAHQRPSLECSIFHFPPSSGGQGTQAPPVSLEPYPKQYPHSIFVQIHDYLSDSLLRRSRRSEELPGAGIFSGAFSASTALMSF